MTLKEWKQKNGYNQATIAKLVGVTQATISRLLNGKQEPKGVTIAKIEEATNGAVTARSFFPSKGNQVL